jgi:murein DD-endopeptidase MepM/ murein hydrolase activator NlpD
MHQGIDIHAPHGTSIVAADSGTVVTAGYGRGWGNYIVVSHGNGVSTLYSHMSSFAVGVGASVSKGQHIGAVGSSGNATTPHLHFEVIVNGTRIDPMTKL